MKFNDVEYNNFFILGQEFQKNIDNFYDGKKIIPYVFGNEKKITIRGFFSFENFYDFYTFFEEEIKNNVISFKEEIKIEYNNKQIICKTLGYKISFNKSKKFFYVDITYMIKEE